MIDQNKAFVVAQPFVTTLNINRVDEVWMQGILSVSRASDRNLYQAECKGLSLIRVTDDVARAVRRQK